MTLVERSPEKAGVGGSILPGLGGHCIPVDPYYLSWKAKEFDFQTRFIEQAGDIEAAGLVFPIFRASSCMSSEMIPSTPSSAN